MSALLKRVTLVVTTVVVCCSLALPDEPAAPQTLTLGALPWRLSGVSWVPSLDSGYFNQGVLHPKEGFAILVITMSVELPGGAPGRKVTLSHEAFALGRLDGPPDYFGSASSFSGKTWAFARQQEGGPRVSNHYLLEAKEAPTEEVVRVAFIVPRDYEFTPSHRVMVLREVPMSLDFQAVKPPQ